MCTTIIFGAESHKYLAENYDHSLTHGLVGVNLQGTVKENGRQPGEKAIRWNVKYGSITFNQFSLELPVSGMNEAGMAVALMWHYEGNFGTDEQYSRISALQWIQYQLDNYRNIADVLEGLKTIRPKQEGAPLHYSILDAEGNSLLVEFVDGELRTYENPEYPILTNTTYQVCYDIAKGSAESSGFPENPSIARFVHLYRQYPGLTNRDINADTGFELLQSVNQTPAENSSYPWNDGSKPDTKTAWSIVFNPSEKSILFKTHENDSVREIRLSDFNFNKEAEYRVMNINDGVKGNAAGFFKPYSIEYNREIIKQTAKTFPMPEPMQDGLANMVDSLYRMREMRLG